MQCHHEDTSLSAFLNARGAPPPLALARRLPPSLKLRRTAVALAEAGRASLGPQALPEPRAPNPRQMSCTMAFLVLLAAAARARVVPADLGFVSSDLLDRVVAARSRGTRRFGDCAGRDRAKR